MKCIVPFRLGQTRESLRPVSGRRIAALLLLLACVLAAASGIRAIIRAREDRLHLSTGAARWIWWTADLTEPSPVRFYAARSFLLAAAPPSARARIFVDRGWELFVNGQRVASGQQKPGDRLIGVDLSGRLRAGRNLLTIAAESPTGAGGILFALDLAERANAVVSDSSWLVTRSEAEAREGAGRPTIVWGSPPMHPWRYP